MFLVIHDSGTYGDAIRTTLGYAETGEEAVKFISVWINSCEGKSCEGPDSDSNWVEICEVRPLSECGLGKSFVNEQIAWMRRECWHMP